jgi:acyl carrier protein
MGPTLGSGPVHQEDFDNVLKELVRLTSDYAQRRDVTATTHFISDLALSSLKVMNLMADVEDHFDVEIPVEQLPKIRTVGDAANSVLTLLGSRKG